MDGPMCQEEGSNVEGIKSGRKKNFGTIEIYYVLKCQIEKKKLDVHLAINAIDNA